MNFIPEQIQSVSSVQGKKVIPGFEMFDLRATLKPVVKDTRREEEEIKIKEVTKEWESRVEQLRIMIQSIQDAWEGLMKEKDSWFEETKKQITSLVLYLTERLLEQEMQTNPQVIEGIINKLLDEKVEGNCVLKISSMDHEMIKNNHSDFFEKLNKSGIVLEADLKCPQGTCLLQTPKLTIDASIFKKMENLWEEAGRAGLLNRSTEKGGEDAHSLE